jgi:hypothetical protein
MMRITEKEIQAEISWLNQIDFTNPKDVRRAALEIQKSIHK